MRPWSVYSIRFLLLSICEKPEALSPQERISAGVVARRLLEFVKSQDKRDNSLVRSAIEAVCRTYESDPVTSKAMLGELLMREHLEQFGYEDMPTFAREVRRLFRIDPSFVRDVYAAAFSFEETLTDQTAMGPGRILPLTSNRRQDYEHALWQLGEVFPEFLKIAPEAAIEGLVHAVTGQVIESYETGDPQSQEQEVEINGVIARLHPDGSHIWDASTRYRHDPHEKMLDAFETELDRVASNPELAEIQTQILSAVIRHNKWAAIWRRVIACGTRHPSTIGIFLAPVASSDSFLVCIDTSSHIGDFIKAVYPQLSVEERQKVERAILAIPSKCAPDRQELAGQVRNRLLGCIPDALIATEEARAEITELNAQGGPPPNEPPYRIISSFEGVYPGLTRQGNESIQNEPIRTIVDLAASLQQFVNSHSQAAPTLADMNTMIPAMRQLHEALNNASHATADEMQVENGWTQLIGACACLARCNELDRATDKGHFIRELLLDASRHPSPVPDPDHDVGFDDQPSWSPAPRIDAATGLLFFAHNLSSVDADIVETVRRLSKDPVPAVRLKIADHLGTLWKTSPDIVTEIVADMAEHDSSSCVVLSLLNRPMHGLLLWQCPEEVGKWAEIVFGRTDFGGKTARDVRSTCAFIFLELFLWKNHARSETFIHDFTGDILQYTGEATRIVAALREILVSGPIDPPDPIAEAARTRSFMVLEEIATSVPKAFSVLQQTHKGKRFSEWPAQDREMINKMAQLLDCIATQLYFASGAYDEKPSQKSERHVSDEQKKRFLKESEKLFSLLSIEPHPSTVQHVVDTLQSLLDIDPRTVFLRIVNFVKAGKDEGYQYESLAVDLIVRVVNRVFADFRPMLQEHQDTRDAMVAMLDIFVEAGWLPAIQLTYRLDEIFR